MKKKNIMVHYKLVPNSEDGGTPSNCSLTAFKSRVISVLAIGLITLGILLVIVERKNEWTLTAEIKNMSECSPGDKGSPDNGTFDLGNKGLLQRRYPSVLIIGARKAGTRALIRFLTLHRDIVASKKETHFFDRNYHKGFGWYLKQMPYSYPQQLTVEKTPNYFVDWKVPELVHSFNASIKLLLIVRNPIDRALSDYLQLKDKDDHPDLFPPFEDLVIDDKTGDINKSYTPIKRSLYCRHLDKWLDYFNMSQILVVDGENIKSHPWEEVYKVEKFLGLSHEVTSSRFVFNATKGFFCVKMKKIDFLKMTSYGMLPQKLPFTHEKCLNPSKGREHPKLDTRLRRKLKEFFKPFNKKLFHRIGRGYDWH